MPLDPKSDNVKKLNLGKAFSEQFLLQKNHTNPFTPLSYFCNTQCPAKPIGDEMTTTNFTPSAEEASLRRRLCRAIQDAGLSEVIAPSQIVVTPHGFSLGTFNMNEMSKITNILEDIAVAAGTQFLTSRRSKSMQQSMQVPVRIPVDFKPAKVVKYAKETI